MSNNVNDQEELSHVKEKYQRLFELAGDGILLIKDDVFIDCNPRAAQMLGYESPSELINRKPFEISPEKQPDGSDSREYALFLTRAAYKTPLIFEWVHLQKNGARCHMEISLTLFDHESGILLVHWRDISERKQMEQSLRSATRLLERAGRLAHVGGWEYCYGQKHVEVSQQLAEMLGLTEAGQYPARQMLRLLNPDERKRGCAYIKRLMGSGRAWDIDLPVRLQNGQQLWLRLSSERIVNSDGISCLSGAVQDITQTVHAKAAQQQKDEEIMTGHLQLMQAMSLALEKRDPYTAGHQNRVADLAAEIARYMGFDDERLQGLILGATLHDMGKIAIPAEILTRPGRISFEEMELIKRHAQIGYEIIRDVSFPWPIAQMLHQHHERMDGSGYPQGLAGEDILLEARIISVADVVEAMASHRPYREALGIEQALEEIREGQNTRYDPKVVNACLKVFAGGFTL